MDDQPQALGGDLKRLALAKFGTLSDAENLLLEKVPTGELAICAVGRDPNDFDPNDADRWGPARQIRAELLAWLCTNEQARKHVHPRGIQIFGADIAGPLDLAYVVIPFQLRLRHCRLKGGINLLRAEVPQLTLESSLVHAISVDGQVAPAILADGIVVQNNVFFRNGFTAKGEVRLARAQVGGDLDCGAGTFTNEGRAALSLDGINVKGSVFLGYGFTAKGEVNLARAQVGGDLDCDAGTFTNEGRAALNAGQINVKGAVFLRQGTNAKGEDIPFSAKGEVNLDLAQIDGQLECGGGVFSNPGGNALSLYRTVVRSSVFLRVGFIAEGKVYLEDAQIGGSLDCRNGNFQTATLDLRDASAGTLYDSGLNDIAPGSPADSPPTKWPQPGELLLDGFTYGRISSEGRINARKRIKDWLELQPQSPFHPKPYLQLAKILKESGDDKGRKRVLIEMEDRLRKGDILGPMTRPLLRWTIGYGYYPLRIIFWAAGLAALGWFIYQRSYVAGGMVPTDEKAFMAFREPGQKLPAQYPRFFAPIYSVENSLPLVKLGQADKWQPDPEPDPEKNQSIPKLGHRGKWPWSWRKSKQAADAGSGETGDSPNLPQTVTVAVQEAGSLSAGTGAAAAAPPARAPEPGPSPQEQSSPIERILIAIGLRPATDPKHVPSFLSRFGTSPRFVTWFLWFQILLGWLLATLFIAGVSGIVHKE